MKVRLKIGPETASLIQKLADRRGLAVDEAMQDVLELVGDDIEAAIGRAASIAWYRDAAESIEDGRYHYG